MSINSTPGSEENGYRLTTTNEMGSIPCARKSSRCVGSSRSAKMPACTLGCKVTTRCPSIAGNPVSSATSVTASPAASMALAVPPLDTRVQPARDKASANSTIPVLSYTLIRAVGTL